MYYDLQFGAFVNSLAKCRDTEHTLVKEKEKGGFDWLFQHKPLSHPLIIYSV